MMIGRWLKRLADSIAPKPDAHALQPEAFLERLHAKMESQARPCVRLTSAEAGESVHTRIGGLPPIRDRFEWPHWKGQALGFVAKVELSEIQAALNIDWLPSEGRLLFFYDADQQAWGFDPKDKGGCAVIFDTALDPAPLLDAPITLTEYGQFSEKHLAALASPSYPSLDRLGESVGDVSEDVWDAIAKRYAPDPPLHQMSGYPYPIQNDDMELESQLASNGIYLGRPEGWASLEAQALEQGAKDWVLLLQIDSDHDADIMWGDSGMIYFWIRKQDAETRDFSKVWSVLQCC